MKKALVNSSLIVSCPHCKEEFRYYSCETRPFCSLRCKNHDLISWAQEQHRIPTDEKLSEVDLDIVLKSLESDHEH